MGVKSVIKKGFSFGFQPKRWLGVEQVKSNGKICVDLVRDYMAKPQVSEAEQQTLQAEATALKADTKALHSRQKLALSFTFLYLAGALAMVGYAVFLWVARGFILPGSVCFLLSFLVLSYSLREFMVYAQIRCGGDKKPLLVLLRQLWGR